MVRFIKVVSEVDKFTDCVPILSTLKNIGILLYQVIHKVNKVANPVNSSWIDDIKIHVLSKSDVGAGIASIPVIGNIAFLLYQVKHCTAKLQGDWFLGMQIGYLGEASRKHYYGTKKHSYEITALYLARNPNRAEKKMAKSLNYSAIGENNETFKLILESREWSTTTLKDILKSGTSLKNYGSTAWPVS